MIDFRALQSIYNQHMDSLLSSNGLSTKVIFSFGSNKKRICPNCIFDVNLKKSSNKYKTGGPIEFELGRLCPYCNGVGYDTETSTSTGYLAVIWDYKKWISPPLSIAQPDGMIQTISDMSYLWDIRQCSNIEVIYPSSNNKSHKFILYGEPNPEGLGDNNYLICMWKKVN